MFDGKNKIKFAPIFGAFFWCHDDR